MTNYTRWATVGSLTGCLFDTGYYISVVTDIAYPLEYQTMDQLIHALSKDPASANYGPLDALIAWESRLATASLTKEHQAENLPNLIANYNRRRDALVAFLKSE
jgi:hypothetical protein